MPTTEKPGLTRDAIKYLAIFTMLLNHIANVLLPETRSCGKCLLDYWLLHSHYHVLFSCGRLLLYTFQEKIR